MSLVPSTIVLVVLLTEGSIPVEAGQNTVPLREDVLDQGEKDKVEWRGWSRSALALWSEYDVDASHIIDGRIGVMQDRLCPCLIRFFECALAIAFRQMLGDPSPFAKEHTVTE